MSHRLVIFGAGGLAREFHEVVESINDHDQKHGQEARWDFLGFIDEHDQHDARVTSRGPVLGGDDSVDSLPAPTHFVVAIANTEVRRRVAARAESAGLVPATLIHPSALVGTREVHIGGGSVVGALAILTTDITVGSHVHLDRAVNIGHDSVLEDFVSVYPSATIAGAVTLGRGSTIASAATVIQGIRVGENAFVGAGAVVIDDVRAGVTVIGVPAREMRS